MPAITAGTIYDCYLRRQLIEIGTETVNDAYEHDIELEARQLMEVAEKKLFDLATTGSADGGFQPFVQAPAHGRATGRTGL